jgi:hypothetical protein
LGTFKQTVPATQKEERLKEDKEVTATTGERVERGFEP